MPAHEDREGNRKSAVSGGGERGEVEVEVRGSIGWIMPRIACVWGCCTSLSVYFLSKLVALVLLYLVSVKLDLNISVMLLLSRY